MTRIYGKWAGKPNGTPEDTTRCIEAVRRHGEWHSRQCCRKRGFGPGGLYCKQHDPQVAGKRIAESRALDDARWARRMIECRGVAMAIALRAIADGHNDPRSLAKNVLSDVRAHLDTLGK